MDRKHVFSCGGLLLALWVLLGGCYLSRKVPTETVSRQGTDSVQIKEGSILVSGLRVLLVNRADTVTGNVNLAESSAEVSLGNFWPHDGWGLTRMDAVKGQTQDGFYSQVGTGKAAEGLKQHAELFAISGTACLGGQLDSLCRNDSIDLVIVNEGMRFFVNQDATLHLLPPSTYSMSGGNTGSLPAGPALHGASYSSTVYYIAQWRLLWRDASQPSGFREQTIVQRGGYWNMKYKHPGGDILSCALKAGEDFARLFR